MINKSIILLFGCCVFMPPVTEVMAQTINSETAFSPDRGATSLITKTINSAQQTVRIAAYTFTATSIADALIAAHNRGVDVRAVLDEKASHQKSSLAAQLTAAGVPVHLDDRHAIMHDKFAVIDDAVVETGSFNYTEAAERRNAENVVVIHDPQVAQDYAAEWEKLWAEGYSSLPAEGDKNEGQP